MKLKVFYRFSDGMRFGRAQLMTLPRCVRTSSRYPASLSWQCSCKRSRTARSCHISRILCRQENTQTWHGLPWRHNNRSQVSVCPSTASTAFLLLPVLFGIWIFVRGLFCNLVYFSDGGVLESLGVCLSLFNCSDDGGNLCEQRILT